MNISLVCNPFKKENILYLNGKEYNNESKINEYKNKYVYEIDEKFISDIVDELNYKNLTIKFTGSIYDFEIMQNLAEEHNLKSDAKVTFVEEKIINKLDKRKGLEEILELAEKSNLDEDYKEKITKPIKSALSEDTEIAVISTISSGKSTLLNAIIGQKIMPTSENVCTANVTTLRNKDIDGFRLVKLNDKEVDEEVDLAKLEQLKEDKDIKKLTIDGSIDGLKNIKNISLVDTPGANNADDEEHKKITMNFIKSSKKAIVLFLFSTGSISTNDTDTLLKSISEEIKREDNKIDEDRFIFVVNKCDNYDDEEDLEKTINTLNDKLKNLGISSPKIHFISANNALLKKLQDKNKLNNKKLAIKFSELEENIKKYYKEDDVIIKYYKESSLSNNVRRQIEIDLEKAIKEENYKEVIYILSGVKGLEMTISEIVDKYKNINLVGNALNEVYRELKKEELYNNIQNNLSEKKEEVELLQRNISDLLNILQKSDIKKKLQEEITSIDFPLTIKEKLANVNSELNEQIIKISSLRGNTSEYGGKYIKRDLVENSLKELHRKTIDLKVDIDTECERYIKDEIYKKGEYIINKYKENLLELLGEVNFLDDLKINQFISLSIPNISSFIDEKKENITVKNKDRKYFWQFWKPRTVDIEVIEFSEVSKYTQDISLKMKNYINETNKILEKEKKTLINNLIDIVEKMDKIIEDTLDEISNICKHKDSLEKHMSEEQELLNSLNIYKNKIEKLLMI